MAEPWLMTLQTPTLQSGWELAVKMSRMGVKITQPSDEIRRKLRMIYEEDADSLIMVSQVIAINFQTVAAANCHWQEAPDPTQKGE